jgi:hypothetical protein
MKIGRKETKIWRKEMKVQRKEKKIRRKEMKVLFLPGVQVYQWLTGDS